MAIALEKRVRKLEKTIPRLAKVAFEASVMPADPPLGDDDPRLVRGVEEFEFTHPPAGTHPGRQEKRGRGFISPWCKVEFWNGGNKNLWNKILRELRRDDTFFHGFGVISIGLCFDKDGNRAERGHVIFMLQFHPLDENRIESRWYRPPSEAEREA